MIRKIYTKIFLWFWVAIVAVTASVIAITFASGSQPFGQKWLSSSLDLYAASAVDFYSHGGTPALQKYLNGIEQSAGIKAELIGPQGEELSGRGIPPAARNVLQKVKETGISRFHTRLVWTGASIVQTKEGTYYLAAQVFPVRGMFPQPSFRAALLKMIIAVLCAGVLCAFLARHIAEPIRTLQVAAGKIADGDLSVRATPAISPRNDEIAELAEDFDRMAERIQSLLRQQKELLGDISHELRSPLTRMSVSLELARRGDTDSLERMQSEIDKLNELIGQILTLTRLEAQEMQNPGKELNLRTILESVVSDANFEGQCDEKSVQLVEAVDFWVKGDAALLRSCMENVVRNAVRYTRPKSSVEVRLTVEENAASPRAAKVLVEDHGEGVAADSLSRLFEPFYRVSEARDRSSGGAGLGLAISQKVVLLYGGTISARNRTAGGLAVEMRFGSKESRSKS